MNDSTSAILSVWPTRWPNNSFTGIRTWLLAGFVAALFIFAFVAGLKTSRVPALSPMEFDALILLQFVIEGILLAIVLAALPALSKFSFA